MLAIIGGSGVGQLFDGADRSRRIVRTPWGDPSAPLVLAQIQGVPILFLARHGAGHIHPPHRINYRANIHALREAGATRIIALASVGGIAPEAAPGALIVPKQIIDYTWGRESTYFDGADKQVKHIDFTHPYDAELRTLLLEAAQAVTEPVFDGGVYATSQGPRLETAAEIERMRRDGATIVGMTGMPEASLAREAGLAYAHLCFVVNWAAGIAESTQAIDLEAISQTVQACAAKVRRVVEAAITLSRRA